MKSFILLITCLLFFTGNTFGQVRQKQKIGLTTLTDQGNEFNIDRQLRLPYGAIFDASGTFNAGLTINSSPMYLFGSNIISTGHITLSIGDVNLLAGKFKLNSVDINSIFSGLAAPNSFSRAQNFDTLSFTNSFNLNQGGIQLLQVTSDGSWYADHYDFYSKGVKRVSIDGDSNKIKIYSGPDQISLWNNNGVLDINAPVVSHGGFEAAELEVVKTLNISGVIKSLSLAVSHDTLFADSGMVFTKTLSANTSFKIKGLSNGQTITVAVTNTTGDYTVEWTALGGLNLYWPNGDTPVQTLGDRVDLYTFQRIGDDIYAKVTQNYK